MSAIRLTYLYCDGEGCDRGAVGHEPLNIDPHPDDTAASLRADAKGHGWKRRNGKDYCGICAERMRAVDKRNAGT